VVEVQRQVEEFEREFQQRNGIQLQFDGEAIDRITDMALEEDMKGQVICLRLLKDYEHGIKLIRDRIGRKEFVITREAIDDPEEYLNRIIQEAYSRRFELETEGKG
jgi:hypothetical protein